MKARNIGPSILIAAGLAAVVLGGGAFIRQEGDYAASNAEYETAREAFLIPSPGPGRESGDGPELPDGAEAGYGDIIPAELFEERSGPEPDAGPSQENVHSEVPEVPDVDWDALTGVNPDAVGWITIPAIDVSYPVLLGDDNDEYLHRTMYGSYLYAGSIFLDAENSGTWSDMNTVIYGHNMRNGSMFGRLKEFRDEGTYKECPYILISSPGGEHTYQVMSVRVVDIRSDAYRLFGADGSGEAFREWCEGQAARSEYPCPLPDNCGMHCITLSTCTAARDDTRLIVQAAEVLSDIPNE